MLRRVLAWFTPARWTATGMAVVAGGCVYVWDTTKVADAWMPNAATGLVGLGLTVTLVEWIIRREHDRRMRPWVERIVGDIRMELWLFAQSVAIEYAGTHLHDTYEEPPRELLALLDFYDQGLATANASRVPLPDETVPLVYHAGRELAEHLRTLRAADLPALTPELVRAIDDYVWHVSVAFRLYGFSRNEWAEQPAESRRHGEQAIIRSARAFAEAALAGEARNVLDDLAIRANAEHSRNAGASTARRLGL